MTDPMACPRCGQPHERCAAHNRAGGPCGLWPKRGQRVCGQHGGLSPGAEANARRRLAAAAAEADARAVLAHEGVTGVADPVEALARLASEADAFRGALARRVNALEQVRYMDDRGSEQLRGEVALYERAIDRTARLVESLAKLDLAGWAARREQERLELDRGLVRLLEAAFLAAVEGLPADEVAARARRFRAEIETRQARESEGVA